MRIASLRAARLAAFTAVACAVPLGAVGAEGGAPAADALPAVWVAKELSFVYQGFTSRYSCDGLFEKMRRVLLELGAREDLDVSRYGCTAAAGAPDPFPGVRIRMNVLTPAPVANASPAGGTPPAATVPAQWKKVDVRLNRDPVYEAGDCELIEQIKQKILPQFTTRSVEFSSNCVPHQLSAGGTWLRAEVLITDQKDDKALAAK